jgi:hypothetical protein
MCSLTNTDDEQLIEAVSNHSASYDLKHRLVEVPLKSHTNFRGKRSLKLVSKLNAAQCIQNIFLY